MQSFIFYSPTKVIFGKNTENETAKEIKKFGGNRVFVIYGSKSVKENGILKRIEEILKKESLEYELFGGVRANPYLSYAREAVKHAIAFKTDFILAVGGGSVIDTAKAVAHGVANKDIDIWDFWNGKSEVLNSIPIGSVLTISAAGSETSVSSVLTNEETLEKRGLSTDFNRPKFAIMNPILTYTLPSFQIASGIVDIMMHTLDRYFGDTKGNETTDALAEAILRVTIKNGSLAMKSKNDYNAMSELMWTGSLSHNGLTGLGITSDFITHKLGHELSAKFDATHGASLSSVWGAWALYSYKEKSKRFIQFSKNVWNIEDDTGLKGIDKTIEYFKSINMPTNFKELGIGVQNNEVLEELADRCTKNGTVTFSHFNTLKRDDILNIYKMANK